MAAVLVSGGAHGVGAALVEAYRALGETVYAGTYPASRASDLELNVRSIESCSKAVEQLVAATGSIDMLINCATKHLAGGLVELDQDAFKETLDVNLLGAWRLTKAAVPYMRPGSTVAMISSLSGLVGLPGDGAYASSKFALEGMSQSLAAELAPLGIRVMLFEPGRIATEFPGVTDGMPAEIAAQLILNILRDRDAPFRNPIGADAARIFELLGVDSGERSEAIVREVSGTDWNWERHVNAPALHQSRR